MENDINIFQKIFDTLLNPETNTARILLIVGVLSFFSGVIGEVVGLGAAIKAPEWVLIASGIFLVASGVALELRDKEDRQAAAVVFGVGLIIAIALAVVFLIGPSDPAREVMISPTPPIATDRPTATHTTMPTPTSTDTPTVTVTTTPTTAPTLTATPQPTATATPSPTNSPTLTATPTETPTPLSDTYTTRFRETLFFIARNQYDGSEWRYLELCVANRDRVGNNCDIILSAGVTLQIPRLPDDDALLEPGNFYYDYTETDFYTVQAGDSLWRIAEHYYDGQSFLWPEICIANRGRISLDCEPRQNTILTIPLLFPFTPTPLPTATATLSPTATATAAPTATAVPIPTFTLTPTSP